jgi:hypothetical protein
MKHLFTLVFSCLFSLFLSAQNEGDQFFADPNIHEIRFNFSQPGYWDSLTHNYTFDVYMACEVSIDGQSYPQSGVKFKGNSSYNNPGKKKPFRIDLAEYVADQSHDGLKKLVLNNAFKDPTLLREKLMLDYLNAHGVAAPRAGFARVYLNNHYWGLYTVVEDVNKTFLKDRFNNKSGNLFKGDPRGRLEWKGPDPTLYQTDYELKTNETANDWSDLVHLIQVLNNIPQNQFADSLSRYLNLDSWYDYWAAHSLFVNLDSYIGSGHNYFLYHNADTDKFEWITWDVNEAFGNFQMNISLSNLKVLPFNYIPQPAQSRPMMNKILSQPAMLTAYAQHYCTLLQDFSNAALGTRIDALANLIRADVYADSLKFFTNAAFEQNRDQDITVPGNPGGAGIAGLKPFITTRRNFLFNQLAAYGCSVTGTEGLPLEASVSIFPNPSNGTFQLQALNADVRAVSVWSADGRLIQQTTNSGSAQLVEIQISNAPAGLYFVQVLTENGVVVRALEIGQ